LIAAVNADLPSSTTRSVIGDRWSMVHVAIRYVSVQDVSKRVPFAIKMYKLPRAGFDGALFTLQMRVKSCERLLADFVFAEDDGA
jgi:hypothetical protein